MGIRFLNKIANKIEQRQNTLFTYPVEKQKKYVEHFPEPEDGLERGYFQYRCQMKLNGKFMAFATNAAALPVSLLYRIKFRRRKAEFAQKCDAVFFDAGKPANIIPDSVWERYPNIEVKPTVECCLTKEDRLFLKKIYRRYPFSWLLWLKVIIKVAQYSHAITKHSPEAIISCDEFSFTSSILTEYCRYRGIKLINVMHGEKLYHMRDSFMQYDEYYVWSEHYVKLLTSLRAEKSQFRVELPQSMRISSDVPPEKEYDYTYYLTDETGEKLKAIASSLTLLSESGLRISLRPHPRYSDAKEVAETMVGINVEDCSALTIEHSLLRTGGAISAFSTVLNQAYHAGIAVVFDDISDKEQFEKLKELQYVMLEVEHKKLSDLTKESQDELDKKNNKQI